MNLKEFANVDSFNRDLDTGIEISWHDYMGRVIEKLGIENIKRFIPFGLDYLKEKLKEDIHFNNTDIRQWDSASGFVPEVNRKTKVQEWKYLRYGLGSLFVDNGITCFSPSDGVCVLKEAARRLCGVNIMTKYQAYAWNGSDYLPISVPIYNTAEEAIREAESIIQDKANDSVLPSIRLHWKEFPIMTREREYYG